MRDLPSHSSSSSFLPAFLTSARGLPLLFALLALPALAACSGGENKSNPGGSGGAGAGGAGEGGAGGAGGAGGGPPADACAYTHDNMVEVKDAAGLTDALKAAAPGTLIKLAAGTYSGMFDLAVPGTKDKPIIVCGPREAVLDGGDLMNGQVLRLKADNWVLSGFTIQNGRKAIVIESGSDNLLSDLSIHDIGEQAIQIRKFSSRNTLQYSEIRDTGLGDPTSAEGIYVGSAQINWADVTGAADKPDTCDGTRILFNKFGPGIKTEHIDLKEGTTGGEVRGNTFDGTGITGANYEDSWVSVTGNKYTFTGNQGSVTPKDGFQAHVVVMGWGNDNVFEKNVATINGPGYGFQIDPMSTGNVVRCDNQAPGAKALSNVDCTK
jgi:hypothetical protein